jgi:hypothetical protein
MRLDFSTAGRAARDTLPVPAIPYDAIRRRSAAAAFRARAQLLAVCFAVALIGVSTATGLAQKTLAGVRIWLSADKAALAVDSFVMVRDPLASDVWRVIDSASFAPVLPTRFPRGTHVSMLMYSPQSRPNTISLEYRNDRTGYHSGLTVVATSAIERGSVPSSAVSRGAFSWRVGGETVLIPREQANEPQILALKTDLSSAQPRTFQESLLRTVTVLGASPPVADAVQGYADPGSVLIGSQFVGTIARLAEANQPLPDSRIVTLTNIPSGGGGPDYSKATLHWSTRTAVPSDGLKAVDAVLRASKPHCKCAILYSGEAGGAYNVALVAASPPYAAVRYTVSKRTLFVRRTDPGILH